METPSGAIVAIDAPALIGMLGQGLRGENHIRLVRSDRALTDCRDTIEVNRLRASRRAQAHSVHMGASGLS
jgi:hypothetical protein